MEASCEPFAFIDCIQCPTARSIFESIINQLTGHVPGPVRSERKHKARNAVLAYDQVLQENDFENHTRCDRLNDFLTIIAELARSQRIFIVCCVAVLFRYSFQTHRVLRRFWIMPIACETLVRPFFQRCFVSTRWFVAASALSSPPDGDACRPGGWRRVCW
jgi:hypothetical protein